jgi:hypothetical protein
MLRHPQEPRSSARDEYSRLLGHYGYRRPKNYRAVGRGEQSRTERAKRLIQGTRHAQLKAASSDEITRSPGAFGPNLLLPARLRSVTLPPSSGWTGDMAATGWTQSHAGCRERSLGSRKGQCRGLAQHGADGFVAHQRWFSAWDSPTQPLSAPRNPSTRRSATSCRVSFRVSRRSKISRGSKRMFQKNIA